MGRLDALVRSPKGPYLVLAAAILLPGAGHVLVGQGRRGLVMQMFMILLALVTWHLTSPAQSLVGRLAGGLFVYAISIPEAYRLARLKAASAVSPKDPPPATSSLARPARLSS